MRAKLAHLPTTRVACVGGLNGVGKACDGRGCCWLPWPPSDELEAAEPPAEPSEVSSSAGVVVGGGSLFDQVGRNAKVNFRLLG